MNFLVILETSLDDLPLRLFPTFELAEEWAKSCDYEAEHDRASHVVARDHAEPCHLAVVEFINGESAKLTIVRSFDDEQ